ncbi:RNI-like protein [Trichocladium antarcticum]|uniref:RNI-like protein n=1 Tax=Trichocladium antarcticum TaxID=1450529 RepID=A0AAN6UQQ7_9PEZI|nr:RNI-like protein [Trichocladium antarcticum]
MAESAALHAAAGTPPSPSVPDGIVASDVSPESAVEAALDAQLKSKGRQSLLRGIQRLSPSLSLAHIGRPRSASSPYSVSGTLSSASLASAPSPLGHATPGSYFSQPSTVNSSVGPTSIPASFIFESPGLDGNQSELVAQNAERHVTLAVSLLAEEVKKKTTTFDQWAAMPLELKVLVLSFLRPRELVRAAGVSREFHTMCFDGQLWASLDASGFYSEIPAESLTKIIVSAGPFVKDLNLRGCVQVEHHRRAEQMAKTCRNLVSATLEGCQNLQRSTLHGLIRANERLVNLNLTGLAAVNNATCKIVAHSCPQLEMFNVSWCKQMDARGVRFVVEGCPRLKDLRAGEIRGFDSDDVAQVIFRTNNLERLVLGGCEDLTDTALRIMIQGLDPEIDCLTGRAMVPPRKLRHLDLARCARLTSAGVQALGHLVPDLEGLQLSGVTRLTDAALEPIFASTPRLTHLELEDLSELTNALFSQHLARAPCAPHLEHLSVSYCEHVGDPGLLPVFRACTSLRTVYMDNTRISDLVLAEAAAMVRQRRLTLVVYDCSHVTWTGVREVLNRNAEPPKGKSKAIPHPTTTTTTTTTTPTTPTPPPHHETITLRCFYGWQMTVDEHAKRVLRGDLAAANRLERKWAQYMQANEEAGAGGAHGRRRRRRAREAQQAAALEGAGGGGANGAGAGAGGGGSGEFLTRSIDSPSGFPS